MSWKKTMFSKWSSWYIFRTREHLLWLCWSNYGIVILFFEEKYMREKSSLRCLSVHYICVTSLEAFQWPSSKLPLNQGKIIVSIEIIHLFVRIVSNQTTRCLFLTRGASTDTSGDSNFIWNIMTKTQNSEQSVWTLNSSSWVCFSCWQCFHSFILPLISYSYYHWSLTRSVSFHLRGCWFIVDSAGDFPWIQNSNNTFPVFWTHLFEQINIHQQAVVKRSTIKLKLTALKMYV